MATSEDTVRLLQAYARKNKNHEVGFDRFLAYVRKCGEHFKETGKGPSEFAEYTQHHLTADLEELAAKGSCELSYEDVNIDTIVYTKFYFDAVHKAYYEMELAPELPFPSKTGLEITTPADHITAVDVKGEFVGLIDSYTDKPPEILRLNFPDNVISFVITSDFIENRLLEFSVQKIRQYLQVRRNAEYMRHKLQTIFRKKEQAMKDMLMNVYSSPRVAIGTVQNPTDFSFQFWTHLASFVIQEYRDKTNKLAKENTYCQAAYLIGYYNMHHKGVVQKEKEATQALKGLSRGLQMAPYYFTLSDIFEMKDKNGLIFAKKVPKDDLNEYIQNITTNRDQSSLPEVIRMRTANKKEYYVHKDKLLGLCAKKILDASWELKKEYIAGWTEQLEVFKKTPEMSKDDAFGSDVERIVREEDPLLHALLRYELLFLTQRETKPAPEVRAEVERILDHSRKALIPLPEILQLDRRSLLAEAKNRLPIWKTVPILTKLIMLFKRLTTGVKKGAEEFKVVGSGSGGSGGLRGARRGGGTAPGTAESGSATKVLGATGAAPKTSKAEAANYQRLVQELKVHFAGAEADIDLLMDELAEKWNPLYDPKAKADLVEDVNSMVRDFMRKIKRAHRIKPPDAARIENIAQQLSENDAFAKIKRRDYFKQYLKIYMVKILSRR